MMEMSTIIPKLHLTRKDHKEFEGEVPPTRPICSAGMTINQRISDLTRDILMSLFKAETTSESSSTEDFLSKIEDVNARIISGEIKPRSLMIGSLDLEAWRWLGQVKLQGTELQNLQ